jgi:hypothetical protein
MKKVFPMRDRCSQPSALEATEGEPQGAGRALAPPDPEVPEKARRRKFSAEYKLRILRLADSCTDPGSLGRLLRKEALYASNLTTCGEFRASWGRLGGVLAVVRPCCPRYL